MRKFFYNEKIKKFLIVIVISAMVFNYILPLKVVYAEQKMNFEDYVMYRVRKLGVKTYDIPENEDLVITR